MEWFYSDGTQQHGPFTEDEFQGLVNAGRIADDTLVRNSESGGDWHPFSTVKAQRAAVSATAEATYQCVECGNHFGPDDVLDYQGTYVCGSCKDIFFQRVREGGLPQGAFEYAGFWIRFLAKIIDGILLNIVGTVLQVIMLGSITAMESEASPVLTVLYFILSFAIPVVYYTFFVGKMGATPGKLALGLKIVRPDGDRVTYLRAFGRYFAEILSSIILFIGYIMAAFDEEKRALHDRICDTRVVKSR